MKGPEKIKTVITVLVAMTILSGCVTQPTVDMSRMPKAETFKDENRPAIISKATAPIYPEQLKRQYIEGSVIVNFLITDKAEIKDPVIVFADPKEIFNDAAIRTVKSYTVLPSIKNGKPVASQSTQGLTFCVNQAGDKRPLEQRHPACREKEGYQKYWASQSASPEFQSALATLNQRRQAQIEALSKTEFTVGSSKQKSTTPQESKNNMGENKISIESTPEEKSMTDAKTKCLALGFKVATESYGQCVIKLAR